MPTTNFKTTLSGKTTGPTGIVVPPEHIAALGGGKKPAVMVTVNGYAYTTTVGIMDGQAMLPFSSDHRKASGLKAGDPIEVALTLETTPRVVEVPEDLASALEAAGLRGTFDTCAPSKRKEWVRQVIEAKAAETRLRRVEKVVVEVKGK
ncbi:MAG: YdeI/OmpD-associated family protein [bacterium]